MAEEMSNDRAKFLADWQKALGDRDALLSDPEGYAGELTLRAKRAREQSIISNDDLSESLGWVNAAYEWALEELLSRELGQ